MIKKSRKWIGLILIAFALCLMIQVRVKAAVIASGECGAYGDNVIWELDEEGTLTISGSGRIKDYRFDDQTPWEDLNITNTVIKNGVTRIGNYAFFDCDKILSVTIPNSVSTIGEYAFDGCSGLTGVTIPNSVTAMGKGAFFCCDHLKKVTLSSRMTEIEGWTFEGCKRLMKVMIPRGITSIGQQAFSGCDSLTSVTIPDSVTSIGRCAFSQCINLKSVTIPKSVNNIGVAAFGHCESLTNVTIQNGITYINENVFTCCEKLKKVAIPKSVTSIKRSAFYLCKSLKKVYYDGGRSKWKKVHIGKNNEYLTNATIHYTKKVNTLKIKGKTANIKYSIVKKMTKTVPVSAVLLITNKGKGTKTFKKISGNKKITIDKKTGGVTIEKGLKKGTYTVKVKVKASGDIDHLSMVKTLKFKLKVK